MNILLVGGTASQNGGVESFCKRARDAMTRVGSHRVDWVQSNTAYLRLASLDQLASCIWMLFRRRKQNWDCLWLQYANLPDLLLLTVSRLLGYRLLVTPHLGPHGFSQSNVVLRRLSARMLALAHGIALVSTSQVEELALPSTTPRYDIKTFLPCCFPAGSGSVGRHAGGFALAHAGRLSDAKGTFLFLEICSILKRREIAFNARLIGFCDEATRCRIDAFIHDNGLASHVEVMGLLREDQLLASLSLADVLIHLSTIDSFPLVVLEAVGCGVYPICKDLPGARSITQTYCGSIVAGPDAAAGVIDVLTSTSPAALRCTAARACQRLRADYAWQPVVAAVEMAMLTRPATGRRSRTADAAQPSLDAGR